jgi:hypothetical protein
MESSTMKPTSWRSLIKVHPAAGLFPMMSSAEIATLAEDIKANGMTSPVTTWRDKDGTKWLLDGRNRLDAMATAGYRFKLHAQWKPDQPRDPEQFKIVPPEGARPYLTRVNHYYHDDPDAYVVSANIHRRHLTGAQKSELIAKLLKADPTKSDRSIAAVVKVDNKTVAAKREQLEAGEEIPHQEARVGRDGKVQPAAKKSARKAEGAPAAEPDQWWKEIAARDDIQAIMSACKPLTPKDREFLRIALIECPEMRMLALAPRAENDPSLSIHVRARLAIHALGEWTEYFTASLAPLIDEPTEDLDPGLRAELIEAFSVAHGVMTLGPAPVALHSGSDAVQATGAELSPIT